ncbi:uncharacterized protein LOC142573058 [Dermacentor variabilis]|uniref:uncharacterized protein LOC142573058 n=1 Tax=Dermacentor variabilis TaxID=34621 RepID=UPI003F5BB1DB
MSNPKPRDKMAPAAVRPLQRRPEEVRRAQLLTAALICLRAKHRAEHRRLQEQREALRRQIRDVELQMFSNTFNVVAVATILSGTARARWRFPRSQRWFEDTLPNLGEAHFKKCFRVSPATFRYIVESCRSDLQRVDTVMTEAISVEKRVAVALYRLCSTAEDRTISELFSLGRSTVNKIYKEFCAAVLRNLEEAWIKMPAPADIEDHMREFFAMTEFPQGVGALDGCHFPVSPPKEHASDYHNYKGWYSMILLAVVDHRYRFCYTNVGSPGRCHDAFVYGRSALRKLVESDSFQHPTAAIEGVHVLPIILCDQAFSLTCNLQKPYANALPNTPEHAFNYNLSKSRRIVENAFGRMKARFRFVMKRMECSLDTARLVIRACCVLHNVCENFKERVEQQWEQEVAMWDATHEQPSHSSESCASNGQAVRVALAKHFFSKSQQPAHLG